MPQSLGCLLYHFIFSTKDRKPLIASNLQDELYAFIGGILREHRGSLIAAGGTADHVHLLVSLHREQSVSDAIKVIKANSTRWIHQAHPNQREFSWQAGYGAFAIGHSGADRVRRYIQNQAEHHRTLTFQEEYLRFLREYDIAFDERYLWQ